MAVRPPVRPGDWERMPGTGGPAEIVARLRRSGHAGPVVAMGADLTPWVDALRSAGVNLSIAKPFDEDRLLVTLAAAAALSLGDQSDDVPLHSDLAAQDGMEGLLAQFCRRVQESVAALQHHVGAGDVAAVRHACLALRGSAGGGYGFPCITASAAIGRTAALCRRASAKRPPPADPAPGH